MKIVVLAVGRMKEEYWLAAEAEYLKRLRRMADVTVKEVADDDALVAAVAKLGAKARLVALDERGESLSSQELATKVIAAEEQHGGGATLLFVIGGAEGLPPDLRKRAHRLLAFGRITLPHRLARIVLVEQLYRAYSILRGEPYHK